MEIYFDNIIFYLQRSGGISSYWYELIKRSLNENDAARVIEMTDGQQNIFRSKMEIPHEKLIPYKRRSRLLERYLSVPFTNTFHTEAIFHSSYYRLPRNRAGLGIVTTLHDFIYEYYVDGVKSLIHSMHKGMAIRKSDGIICISENTKNDLLKFHPEAGNKEIAVIHNGVSNDFYEIGGRVDLLKDVLPDGFHNREYFLFVGDRAKYKNFEFAVRFAAQQKDAILVIVGNKDFSPDELKLLTDELGTSRFVYLRGVSNEVLNILYNEAYCLLYPSYYEGFGIPVIEAMRAGCPVLALNRSSISEIARGYELLVDELSLAQANKKMDLLRTNHLAIKEHGKEIARKFSWDTCYTETQKFYRHILEIKNRE